MGNELIDKYAFEAVDLIRTKEVSSSELLKASQERHLDCLLYTSDAADEV